MKTCDANENHAYLLERFLERLFAEQPASVLDVGCGAGALLRACQERDVRVQGIEAGAQRMAHLEKEGLPALKGSAGELPCADGAFDWVTLRHVPHHLEDPHGAFREAARVARVGLLIAEPWYDDSFASQRVARDYDRWLKLEHRRGGRFHADCLDADALCAALPEQARADVELESVLRLRARSLESLALEAGECDPREEQRRALDVLRRRARSDGLSWNGSLFLIARLS